MITIQDIMTQLETSHSKPMPMVLHNNNLLFCSPMTTTDKPEMLFYIIKQYQEIATLAGDPFTPMQIMNTVMHILMQAQVLPLKKIDTWEQTAVKTYPGLKTFIHEAYTRCLQSLALRTMTGQQGYAQGGNNMFNMLAEQEDGEDTDTANDATTVTLLPSLQAAPLATPTVEPQQSHWRSPRQSTNLRQTRWPSNNRWRQ